jgi:hypothetical protein
LLAGIPTHAAWIKGAFRRQLAALMSVSGGKVPINLSVQSGLMQGMSEAFMSDSLKIGSGAGSDIVLLDDGILARHLTLNFRRSLFGVLVGVSAFGSVTFGDQTLESGQESEFLRLPQVIRVGDVMLTFAQVPETALKDLPSLRGVASIVGILSFATAVSLALAAPLLNASNSFFKTSNADAATNVDLASRTVDVAAAVLAATTERADSAIFFTSVKTELTRLGLQDILVVSFPDRDLLSIAGSVPSAKWQEWRTFKQWYDGQVHAPVMLQDVAQAAELVTLKPVAMIRLSEPAEISFRDGEKRIVGQIVADNWLIKAITSDGLILTRGEETVAIAF